MNESEFAIERQLTAEQSDNTNKRQPDVFAPFAYDELRASATPAFPLSNRPSTIPYRVNHVPPPDPEHPHYKTMITLRLQGMTNAQIFDAMKEEDPQLRTHYLEALFQALSYSGQLPKIRKRKEMGE